ncbi:MAG: hypothetical protein JWQ89_2300 [Devosia sp.]|uniref:hypothetical protein n=1 Tax=Devosia sp. TaxID=1871048 RepID=UPI0026272D56|nr:hypothetical protein [Devosia sp.]MDB5540573.1 hypothetical protein [Devosia sp.]
MPYTLTYQMIVGIGTRECLSAAEAVADYREIQSAGGAVIDIRDHAGRYLTLDELITVSTPAKLPKSRTQSDA